MNAPRPEAPAAEWLVFADSLQSKGDPRGELIALAHAGDLGKRAPPVQAPAHPLLAPGADYRARPPTPHPSASTEAGGTRVSLRLPRQHAAVAATRSDDVRGIRFDGVAVR